MHCMKILKLDYLQRQPRHQNACCSPEAKLTGKQGKNIEDTLMDQFDLIEDEAFPSFLENYMENGALILVCLNDVTKRWLKKIIATFRELSE